MTPKDLLAGAIDPALAQLDPLGVKSDRRARVLLLAIAGQESEWMHRRQLGGPARSFWQFEGGPLSGLAEVFRVTPDALKAVCREFDVPFDRPTVFEAMAWHDRLAACCARLLLWSDPRALPTVGDVDAAWAYYQRNWRPGAPHPEVWPDRYATALALT